MATTPKERESAAAILTGSSKCFACSTPGRPAGVLELRAPRRMFVGLCADCMADSICKTSRQAFDASMRRRVAHLVKGGAA